MIEVGRNSIVVRNIDKKSQEYKNAAFRFSVYDTVTHKYTFSAFTEVGKDLFFPASIGISPIRDCFPNRSVVETFAATPKPKSISFNMQHQPRDDLQRKAIQFLMQMKTDISCRERFLSLATGSGKTYVTINIASKFKKRTMIIVDSLDLADQWKREFLNHTDLQESSIRILSGQDSVEREIKSKDGKIYIAIHRTLSNLISEDPNSMNNLVSKLGIGFRVFDESHVEFKNICAINALSNVEYTLFLTATPGRSKFTDNHLYGKVFRSIPYFNGKELSGEKYHNVILHKIDSKPPIEWKAKIKTKYGFSSSRWADYICNHSYETLIDDINFLFTKLKLIERNKKVAIMLPTIELIKKVKSDLEILFPEIDIGEFIGEIPKQKRLEQLNKKFILTNDKIFDKAIDVSDLEVLINYVQIGSQVKTEQIIGRLRYGENKASILVDVADFGFDETIKQFKLRRRFYKKKAKSILELNE